ncbi:MAG: DUF4139 domain-containing protein [Verrucomicrobiota bacterium]
MRNFLPLFLAVALLRASPALTVYNGGFAVVRDTLPVQVREGVTSVVYSGATAQVEPDSVILRDVTGKAAFRILEQSYRNDAVSQPMLLSFFEGKELEFVRRNVNRPDEVVRGKVIRSGHVPGGGSVQPIIEVDGRLRFSLPGEPMFPSLGDGSILRPTLTWKIQSPADAKIDAEVAYLSNGFQWEASYNLVAPEKGDLVDVVGWVTINNQSGTTFNEALVKLMAGDVNRVVEHFARGMGGGVPMAMAAVADKVVTEKSFDEFHLYTLANPVTLRDRETKQVEFVRATGVKAERVYVYEGRCQEFYGETPPEANKVQVYRELMNTEANGLGMPLPKGKFRFYAQDDDRRMEFVGENQIDHTPKGERLRVLTGNCFDLVGEHRRTDLRRNNDRVISETYEVKLRNRKKEPVEIRLVEHMAHWSDWTISENALPYTKLDSHRAEFRVPLKPDEEKVITFRVNYVW